MFVVLFFSNLKGYKVRSAAPPVTGCARDHPAWPPTCAALRLAHRGGRLLAVQAGEPSPAASDTPVIRGLRETESALVQKPVHMEREVLWGLLPTWLPSLPSVPPDHTVQPRRTLILSAYAQADQQRLRRPSPSDGQTDRQICGRTPRAVTL